MDVCSSYQMVTAKQSFKKVRDIYLFKKKIKQFVREDKSIYLFDHHVKST